MTLLINYTVAEAILDSQWSSISVLALSFIYKRGKKQIPSLVTSSNLRGNDTTQKWADLLD